MEERRKRERGWEERRKRNKYGGCKNEIKDQVKIIPIKSEKGGRRRSRKYSNDKESSKNHFRKEGERERVGKA